MPKSPYNFVPAPEWKDVFKPDWADQVTHDQPFSDGESGEIEIEIEAETPIFIRSGKEGKRDVQQFPSYDRDGVATPYIPGTSIKGMIRNVMEIISKSMLSPKLVSDDKFSFRNLHDHVYRNWFNQRGEIKAGWLTENPVTGEWVIRQVKYCKVSHEKLFDKDNHAFSEILSVYQYHQGFKNAKAKYEIHSPDLAVRFDVINNNYDDFAELNPDGRYEGVYVFTGQPSANNPNNHTSKKNEFIFYEHKNCKEEIKITEKLKNEFLFVNDEFNSKSDNPLQHWKRELSKGNKMPVFYLTKRGTNDFLFFGMAKMFRFPYQHSIHELQPIASYPQSVKKDGFDHEYIDLTHTIFGYTSEKESLKGRVFFSHAICKFHKKYSDSPVRIVLGSPKASYFPHYLKNDNNINALYNDPISKLSGFKRYFVREKEVNTAIGEQKNDNEGVFVRFNPIGKDSIFNGVIRFHNLRTVEIGALLSAITFHGNNNEASHQIGGAKSHGFGKIKVSIKNKKDLKYDIDVYLKAFERAMYDADPQRMDHFNGEAVRSLISMSSGKYSNNQQLIFPTLQEHNHRDSWLETPILPGNISVNRFYSDFNNDIKNERNKKIYEKILDSKDIFKLNHYIIYNHDVGFHANAILKLNQWISAYYEDKIDKQSVIDLEKFIREYSFWNNLKVAETHLSDLINRNQSRKIGEANDIVIHCNHKKFRDFKNIPNDILRKNRSYQFNERQKNEIVNCVKSIFNIDRKSFFDGNHPIKINQFPWTDIQKWIGESKTIELYASLLN